jgi:endonuclease YncB( thermonuclease family)
MVFLKALLLRFSACLRIGDIMRAILLFLLLMVSPCWASELMVVDADTMILNGITYRLDGIDAPETDQICLDASGAIWACGIEARDQLQKFIGNRNVRCEGKGWDTVYRKRRIGICSIDGEAASLNQWLVREGWAVSFEPYAKGRFKADQEAARNKQHGMWKGCFSAPQEHRNANKKSAVLQGATCPGDQDTNARNLIFPAYPAMPPGCAIKGKFAVRAHMTEHRGIYHLEGCGSYQRTKVPDRWFCSEREAQAEGFRKSFTCRN